VIQADENANGSERILAVGDELALVLPENPTTGFRWELVSDGVPACRLEGDEYRSPSGLPGAGGTHQWRFRATQAGIGTIELRYRRPWLKDAAKTFRLAVRVRD
jgi:inhibitor of cysteine peptidase